MRKQAIDDLEFLDEHLFECRPKPLIVGKDCVVFWCPGQDRDYDSFIIFALDDGKAIVNDVDELEYLDWEDLEIRRKK